MVLSAAAAIEINKQKINELNVFPVPDGDTGTNMCMTLANAAADLRRTDDPTLTVAADSAASAMLRGARGNSGVILSLLFRGIAKNLKGLDSCGGVRFAEAMQDGVKAAYKAVMKPAEGTILTVSRMAADGAFVASNDSDSIEYVLEQGILCGEKALEDTVNQNPVLKKAGVVDAGGVGWITILNAMLSALRGEDVVVPERPEDSIRERADFSEFETEDITFAYCTEFIVSRDNDGDPDALRTYLDGMGDSLVLVEDDEIIKVHVHTNHPGEVLEKALSYGGLMTVKVENMRLQHTEKVLREEDKPPVIAAPEKKYGMVAVCAGSGIAEVFQDLGADEIIEGGQTMNPSTQDILAKINQTPAEIVLVFPNNKNIILAAEQTIGMSEKQILVVPTKTIPQGVSAMLAFDPEADIATNLDAMADAMAGVETMQLTYAARDSEYDGYHIREGDYLALIGSALFGTGKSMATLLRKMAKRIQIEEKEFVTIYYGKGVNDKDAKKALEIFEKTCPDAEINLIRGNQPVYYYLISAE